MQEYLDAVEKYNREADKELPTYKDDFFPYLFEKNEYWAGFYTTFPFIKKTVRQFSDYSTSNQFLSSLTAFAEDDLAEITKTVDQIIKT